MSDEAGMSMSGGTPDGIPTRCFACGGPQVREITTSRVEDFDDGERLVLRDVPAAECASCAEQITLLGVSRDASHILAAMERDGPDASSYLDPRWQPLLEDEHRALEERRLQWEQAVAIPLEGFLGDVGDLEPWEPYPKRCEPCGRDAERSLRYDSMWCAGCDRWLEEPCGTAGCAFCEQRPPRPSLAGSDEQYDGEQTEPPADGWPPALADLSWRIVQELLGGLRENGRRRLAHTVPDLRVWALCGCGDCGSFRTVPKIRGEGRQIETSEWLDALSGTVQVHLAPVPERDEPEIVDVEIDDRPDLTEPLRRAWQSYRLRRAAREAACGPTAAGADDAAG